MRKITFWITLFLVFNLPWENSITIPAVGSLARLLGFVAAGFWLLTILTEGQFRKPNLFHAFVLLFFIWSIASIIWSKEIKGTNFRMKTYLQIFLLLLILWEVLRKPGDLEAGLQAYVLGAYGSIASSIYNYINGTNAVNYQVRYSATGVNAVDLSLILVLGIPLAWHLYQQADIRKNRLLKFLNIAYIPLSIFSILLTAARTSLFAIIPALVYILWPKKLDISRFIFIFILLVISLVVIQTLLPSEIKDRLGTTFTSISTSDIGGRVNIWRETIAVFNRHPFLGNGSGTLSATIGTLAHNTYLSVLAETGLIGFFMFICILAIVINQAIRLPKGYSGLWLSVFFVWVVGVLSLSWEAVKPTWVFFSFVMIEGAALHDQFRAEMLQSSSSETQKG